MFEDLGIQQAPNSTLCSYLNRLLWILTGNFGNPGGMHLHTSFATLFRDRTIRRTPVTGAPIIGGLVPVQRDPGRDPHRPPRRFRAMIVESSQPGSLARRLAALARGVRGARPRRRDRRGDDRDRPPRRLRAARPRASTRSRRRRSSTSSSRDNTFHLRHPLLEPLPGTLPEAEIWARLVRALGLVDEDRARAAARGRRARAGRRTPQAFAKATTDNPMLARLAPYVLYETLGPTLPDGLASAAALWGLAHRCAMTYPDAVRRAGHADGNALFDAILDSPLRSHLHASTSTRTTSANRPPRQADRARAPRDARRAARRWPTRRPG